MIRDVLLGVYALAWFVVMVLTVWRKGEIAPELWLYLGIGAGGLLGIFKAESSVGQKKKPSDEEKST